MRSNSRHRVPRALLVGAAAVGLAVALLVVDGSTGLIGLVGRPAAPVESPADSPPAVRCADGDMVVRASNLLAWPPASTGPATAEAAAAAAFAADPAIPDPARLARAGSTSKAVRLERLDGGRRVQSVQVEAYGNHWVVTQWEACLSSLEGARP